MYRHVYIQDNKTFEQFLVKYHHRNKHWYTNSGNEVKIIHTQPMVIP